MHHTGKSLVFTLFVAIALAGCGTMTVGREFNYASFANNVKPGTTDVKEVAEWLGPPIGKGVEVTADGSRLEVWTWYYGQGKIGGTADREFKMLQVKLNDQGKVVSYVWSGELAGGAGVEEKSASKK